MTFDHRAITRRTWLAGSALALAGFSSTSRADDALGAIRAKGRKAGMDPFEVFESKNFLAIGDATPRYCREALDVCEAVAIDYQKHFKDKGFELDWPKDRMTVVVLASPQSYAAFEGGFVDQVIGGHYDLGENRLVTFDARLRDSKSKAGSLIPEEDNTLQLVHETIHLLTFNTGLLDRKADVPDLVSEGLATYGETWRPRRKGAIGANNLRRLQGFRKEQKPGGVTWIPFDQLLADDKIINDDKTQQVGYFEAWRFVHKMMSNPGRAAKFRGYLQALKGATEPARRAEVAREHLGDLSALDKELRSPR